MHRLEFSNKPPVNWNSQLLSGKTESLHLYHSSHWADRLAELLDYKPVYFSVFHGNELQLMLLGFSVFRQKIFGDLKTKTKQLIKSIASLGKKKFLWYGQPVSFQGANEEAFRFLANSLDIYFKNNNLKLISGEWPISQKEALPCNWKLREWATLKIDLTQDLDVIFSNFKASARKEIRKS